MTLGTVPSQSTQTSRVTGLLSGPNFLFSHRSQMKVPSSRYVSHVISLCEIMYFVGLLTVPYTGTVVLFTARKKYDMGQPVPYWIGTRGGTVRTVTVLITGCHSLLFQLSHTCPIPTLSKFCRLDCHHLAEYGLGKVLPALPFSEN